MAEQMIRFYGFEPEEDIKIEYVGLRAGERLGERLWADNENPVATPYSRILRVEYREAAASSGLADGLGISAFDISALIEKLRPICKFDPARPDCYRDSGLLKKLLAEALPSLQGGEGVQDTVYQIPAEKKKRAPEIPAGSMETPGEARISRSLSWSSAAVFRKQRHSGSEETKISAQGETRDRRKASYF
jgi:hypothetical protein